MAKKELFKSFWDLIPESCEEIPIF